MTGAVIGKGTPFTTGDDRTGIAAIIARRVAIDGAATALVCEGRRTSFAALDRRSNIVASSLLRDGFAVGTRIAYCAPASEIFYDVLYGAAKAGTVFVPLNWRLHENEIVAILNDSEAEVVFLSEAYLGWIAPLIAGCPRLRSIIAISGTAPDAASYPDWLEGASDALPARQPHRGDEVLQLYTSGTTGAPKGVVLTNRIYDAVINQSSDAGWVDWDARDRVLVCMPLFHVGGVNVGLVAAARGACAFLSARADINVILDHIVRDRITIAFLAPTVIAGILDLAKRNGADLSSIRTIYYGASPISETLLGEARTAFDAGFVQLYGLTETGGSVAHLSAAAHELGGRRLRSCGQPNAGTDIRIVDAAGCDCPVGAPGEILVRGPTVMKGYWKRPDETASALANGWFHSGDIGYFDEEGFLYIHDRLKDMIVTGGENVYPAEIENVLARHPAIAEAAIIGVPDRRWGEAVKAVVVLRADHKATAGEIIDFARGELAGYKLPKTVDIVAALPKSAVGKTLRRELRAQYWSRQDRLVS